MNSRVLLAAAIIGVILLLILHQTPESHWGWAGYGWSGTKEVASDDAGNGLDLKEIM